MPYVSTSQEVISLFLAGIGFEPFTLGLFDLHAFKNTNNVGMILPNYKNKMMFLQEMVLIHWPLGHGPCMLPLPHPAFLVGDLNLFSPSFSTTYAFDKIWNSSEFLIWNLDLIYRTDC